MIWLSKQQTTFVTPYFTKIQNCFFYAPLNLNDFGIGSGYYGWGRLSEVTDYWRNDGSGSDTRRNYLVSVRLSGLEKLCYTELSWDRLLKMMVGVYQSLIPLNNLRKTVLGCELIELNKKRLITNRRLPQRIEVIPEPKSRIVELNEVVQVQRCIGIRRACRLRTKETRLT